VNAANDTRSTPLHLAVDFGELQTAGAAESEAVNCVECRKPPATRKRPGDPVPPRRLALVPVLLVALLGCGSPPPPVEARVVGNANPSDPDKVRAADLSVLFVGNSHTNSHDLPALVGEMIRFQRPDRMVYTHTLGVMFLQDAGIQPWVREEIETRPWKAVVVQAQKITVGERSDYPRDAGVALATLARERGAAVYFYSEWGLSGVEGDGKRNEEIYRSMAVEAGVGVAAVGRAWELALAERPDLPLYADGGGNHQSQLGAFLSACVLVGRITGDSPAALADYPYPNVSAADRKFLAEIAARSLAAE
jgi:hypothetical protein